LIRLQIGNVRALGSDVSQALSADARLATIAEICRGRCRGLVWARVPAGTRATVTGRLNAETLRVLKSRICW